MINKKIQRRNQEKNQNMLAVQDQPHQEYTLLGSSWAEGPETENGSDSIEKLEKYSFFQGSLIKSSLSMPKKSFMEGERLCSQGKLKIKKVFNGFDRTGGEIRGQAEAEGTAGKEIFSIRLIFSRTKVERFECGCPKCRRDYYSWYSQKTKCEYVAGTLALLEDYLNKNNLGDATDQNGQRILLSYQAKRVRQTVAEASLKKESLKLMPRVTRSKGELSVSFKVGESRMFVIKKLDEFCDNVENSATDTYGSKTQINHNPENFTEQGRKWIRFINRITREETEFLNRLLDDRYYYGYRKNSVGSSLNLSGWRLDEFYKLLEGEAAEFDDKDDWVKKKQTLTRGEKNLKASIHISAERLGTRGEFHGIVVEGNMPNIYNGTEASYFISDGCLNRMDDSAREKLEPLEELVSGNRFSFRVGRNHMSEFYHKILPQLEEVAEITEEEPETFREYLLPEARYTFYLDAEEKNAFCRVTARYGEKEFSALDVLEKENYEGVEAFRDTAGEEDVLFQTTQWFPEIDWERKELHCGGSEELIYQVMESGTEKLMELGEVRCTKRFLGYQSVKKVRVSVGVSVSSGLLDLDITTEDVPQSELLDILNSYRAKKKYYRLKDGSFVNLDDSSLEMLAEMMDAMHLKPKEFVAGKMHLPMYRTLYLDKMLEENEDVYNHRDSHFREVVKGFKTVRDADFEEPESLSRVMRKYQKNGYKWMRTLETWKFGGILADDMGLGKTLQTIAVLLAAKQEGKAGVSLVVAPAALVFNWGEELTRFAPELKVSLITGTQAERQKKLSDYREADVLVTSYDLLKRDILSYEDKEFLYEVIDEAQYIKNHTTAAAKAVKIIKSQTRFALTGTPIENRLSELWSIFDYLMPGFLYGYDVFKKEMETPIVKNKDEAVMKRLQKMVGPFILRRLKEDVLKDLPEKLEECRYVRFGGTQQKLYDGQVVHMKESLAQQDNEEFSKNKMRILAELTRLRQICCDPSLCFENYKGEAAKLEACLQLIQSAMDGGHRMLVFSQFTSMLEILQKNLDEAGIAYFTITGSTSKEKRLQRVKEFNEGSVPVFLISLKAGGVGLNLTGADMVIHYDPWWNLAVQNQATDRAHRIGQTKKVTVYKLIAKNTIEEKIQKLQETKKDLAEQIIGGEAASLGSMSREELLELLGA